MTPEEREEMRRHFGVLVEDVRSELRLVADGNAMTVESLQRLNDTVDAFRAETTRNFADVRAETRREFAAVRTETANGFTAVRSETAREFAAARAEMADGFASIRAETPGSRSDRPQRTRTRRRPN